jgi:hypothetical protein
MSGLFSYNEDYPSRSPGSVQIQLRIGNPVLKGGELFWTLMLNRFHHSHMQIYRQYVAIYCPTLYIFFHVTNIKYVSYRLREINDFDLI